MRKHPRKSLLLLVFLLIANLNLVWAVRPFITDDSRVVGRRLAQYEGWLRFDKEGGQLWNMAAFGPTNYLELSLGGVLGYQNTNQNPLFTAAAPLVQAKILLKPYEANQLPGIGLVIGTFLPYGKGMLVTPGYGSFAFATITQCIGEGEKFLFHVNLGANMVNFADASSKVYTWGVGTQIKLYKGFHVLGEQFSGDPYVPGTGMAYQVGFRHFFSDDLQIDGTYGKGISGATILPQWFSIGVRVVTHRYK